MCSVYDQGQCVNVQGHRPRSKGKFLFGSLFSHCLPASHIIWHKCPPQQDDPGTYVQFRLKSQAKVNWKII